VYICECGERTVTLAEDCGTPRWRYASRQDLCKKCCRRYSISAEPHKRIEDRNSTQAGGVQHLPVVLDRGPRLSAAAQRITYNGLLDRLALTSKSISDIDPHQCRPHTPSGAVAEARAGEQAPVVLGDELTPYSIVGAQP